MKKKKKINKTLKYKQDCRQQKVQTCKTKSIYKEQNPILLKKIFYFNQKVIANILVYQKPQINNFLPIKINNIAHLNNFF